MSSRRPQDWRRASPGSRDRQCGLRPRGPGGRPRWRAPDRRVGAFKQGERLGVTSLGLIAPAGVPQESADLAHDAGRGGMIARALIGAEHYVVMLLRGLALADRTAQIGDALAEHEGL